MEVPQKIKLELTYDAAVSLPDIYLEKTMVQDDVCTPVFIAALLTLAKTWKQPKCSPTEERIKLWYIHEMEYYSAMTKNEIMPLAATWMDLENVMLSEVNQTQKEFQWEILKKKMIQINSFTKPRQTHRLKKTNLWLPRRGRDN